MRYKIIPIMLVCFLLAFTLVSAKSVEKLDWKANKLTIKEDGVYNNLDQKLKDKDKAEIWIDKKIAKGKDSFEYHVDSLIEEDTQVNIVLFYDIQPDKIDYVSHNGKYKRTYTYNDWTWTDKCLPEEDYCGGYVTINDVTLEYALGSNTFTSAISGATWQNDGVDVSLTEDVDYSRTGSIFTLTNPDYAWSGINASWDYNSRITERNVMVANLILIFIALSILAFILLIINYYRNLI